MSWVLNKGSMPYIIIIIIITIITSFYLFFYIIYFSSYCSSPLLRVYTEALPYLLLLLRAGLREFRFL